MKHADGTGTRKSRTCEAGEGPKSHRGLSLPCNPLRSPPSLVLGTHCRGVSPVCVRRCTSRWFFLLKDLPQVSQVNSRTPAGGSGLKTLPSRGGYKEQAPLPHPALRAE